MSAVFRKLSGRGRSTQVPPFSNPDQAWKVLSLVNEWIRQADTKAGVTLAFLGALGTMLFNLAKGFENRTILFDTLVVVAAALIVVSAVLCAFTLVPRTKTSEPAEEMHNRLYFASIAKNYGDARSDFREVLRALTIDSAELTKDLADQIHANALIATTKTRFVGYAIRFAFAAATVVAAVAVSIGITGV